ncbi:MAG: Gfo/Idh/MocA family oxidoreductase [Chloroflexi bacterium]|nr:Gfo/Idh/MocA family oxidoreductase [Chloroflexota bacterium]
MNPVKIGVVGCGAIAQVHHLPNLIDLNEQYRVTCVCDVSAGTAEYVANKFGVSRWVTDYRDLLATDVDAVLLCHSDPKTEVALAALEAGKHLFIEKPVCFSQQEIEALLAAQRATGVIAQVGYMKIFDPAYEYAQRRVARMDNIRFVQVNHLHPNNALHLAQFDVRSFDDVPPEALARRREARDAARREAIGDVAPEVERAFFLLAGSMIHDLYGLRFMLGLPERVVYTEIWLEGRAVSFVLQYRGGARAVCTWVDLPDLWDFRETLEVYGDDRRILLSYPTGFARGILSQVTVQGIDDEGVSYRLEPALAWETAFRRELRHFHDCIVNRTEPRTPLASAREDVRLIIDIIERFKEEH